MDLNNQPVGPTGSVQPMPPSGPPTTPATVVPSIADAMAQFLEPAAPPATVTTSQAVPVTPQPMPNLAVATQATPQTSPPVMQVTPSLVSDLPPIPAQQPIGLPIQPQPVVSIPVVEPQSDPMQAVVTPTPPLVEPEPAQAASEPVITDQVMAAAMPEPLAEPTPPAQTMNYEPTAIDGPAFPSSHDADMPDATQMELDRPSEDTPKDKMNFRKAAKTATGVFIVLLAGLLIKNNSETLGTHKLTSKGYTYNFKFYRHSNEFSYGDGATGYKHANDNIVGSARPTANQEITTCQQVGNGWKEAFDVTIQNTKVPVCSPDNMTFVTVFNGAGHEQLLTISYPTTQKPDSFPLLKSMFASVSVKK